MCSKTRWCSRAGPWREVAPHYSGVYILNLASRTIACVVEPGTLKTGPAALLDEDTLLLAASYGKDYGTEEYCQFYTAGLSTGKLTPLAGYEASIGNSSVGSDAGWAAAGPSSWKTACSTSSPPWATKPIW